MRNSKLFYWQLWKQQILCLLSHQNGERHHWKSAPRCLSEPWPWNCTSTASKGAAHGQQGPPFLSPACPRFGSCCCGCDPAVAGVLTWGVPSVLQVWLLAVWLGSTLFFLFLPLSSSQKSPLCAKEPFPHYFSLFGIFSLFQMPQKTKYWHSKRRNTVNNYVSK